MRRAVLMLVALAAMLPPAAVGADSPAPQPMDQQLAAAAAAITDLQSRIAGLDGSMTETRRRIEAERRAVGLLARSLYVQPTSLLVVLAESSSLGDAVLRLSDLLAAGERAAATKRTLDGDLARLAAQRSRLATSLERKRELQSQLRSEYSQLEAAALAGGSAGGPLPAPEQPPGAPPPASGAIQQLILTAFAPLGAGAQAWAIRVSRCESGYNPYAVNRSSGASGLFQFLPSTWAHSPWAGQSPFDPAANAQAAAWLYARDGPSQWQCQ